MSKRRKLGERGRVEEMKDGKETQTEEDYRVRVSSVITLSSLVARVGPLLPTHIATVSSNVHFLGDEAITNCQFLSFSPLHSR